MSYKIIKDGGDGRKRGWRVCRGSEHMASFNSRTAAQAYIDTAMGIDDLAMKFFNAPPIGKVAQK